MSDQTESRSDNKSENVPLAEYEILRAKHEALNKEHETLINTLELLEETYGLFIGDLEKNQRVALLVSSMEEIEKWKNKFVEVQKKLTKIEKDIEDLVPPPPLDESKKNRMDSGITIAEAEDGNAKINTVSSDEDVIFISDDEEGNQRESNGGGHGNPTNQEPELSFII